MNDYRLLEESLDVMRKLRNWVTPDYYRVNILPTVDKLKDRLAELDTQIFLEKRKSNIEEYQNTIPDNKVSSITTSFGIFQNLDKE